MGQGQGKLHGAGYTCPHCRKTLDGFTNVTGDASPEPGDVSLCVYCRCGLVFLENGLRALRADEFEAMPDDQRADLLRAGIAAAMTFDPVRGH